MGFEQHLFMYWCGTDLIYSTTRRPFSTLFTK